MVRVMIVDERRALVELLRKRLEASDVVEACYVDESDELDSGNNGMDRSSNLIGRTVGVETLVLFPRRGEPPFADADFGQVRQAIEKYDTPKLRHVVLISSAAVYHPKYSNPGLIAESQPTTARQPNRCAADWRSLEQVVKECVSEDNSVTLTILRPAPTLLASSKDYINRILQLRRAMRFVGHDPSIQLLCPEDLTGAVVSAVENGVEGIFNVAPKGVVPLRKAFARAGVRSIALPRWMQRPLRSLLRSLGTGSLEQADYLRYSFTVSGESIKHTLNFEPQKTSTQALSDYISPQRTDTSKSIQSAPHGHEEFDDFGLDLEYLQWHGRWLFRFLERVYWRIQVSGVENIPAEGGAVLVGIHRGFMPFDGVSLIHLLQQYVHRVPRFLLHPALIKFPVLAEFLTKIGGIVACKANADYVLQRGEILGVFPEGIRGAFRMYRDAYRVDNFGRNDYVKFALRHQVPVIPCVYLGTAEAFPILFRIDWPWWKRNTDWPFFPITPTWPWLPIPLPSKWHLRILEPIPPERLGAPEDADSPAVVEAVSNQVRDLIRSHLHEMRSKRKSIFWGSIQDDAENNGPH